MKLSVIIPTRNRAAYLNDVLKSIADQSFSRDAFEVIVVDNGSADHTRQVVEAFVASAPFTIRYEYAPCPGLHVGRNRGAELANGDILAYLDDDVIVAKSWAAALMRRFASDERIVLVGGPCRPLWEEKPPEWVLSFKQQVYGGWSLGELSILDLGDSAQAVSENYVYGCNFCIRKHVLLDLGGFHPDGMPLNLLRYRGDGETGVFSIIHKRKDMKILYDPDVLVFHRVPKERLTTEYFRSIARRTGIGIAYTAFRSTGGDWRKAIHRGFVFLEGFLGFYKTRIFSREKQGSFMKMYSGVLLRAATAHYICILCSGVLRRWVLQSRYFLDDPCPYWETL